MAKRQLVIIVATAVILYGSIAGLGVRLFLFTPKSQKSVSIHKIIATPVPTPSPSPVVTPTPKPSISPTTASKPVSQWPVVYSLSQASSLTVVVNKKHQLPSNYAPPDLVAIPGGSLRSDAANAFNLITADGAKNGFSLTVVSSYRSYQNQASTYNGYVARDGQALADTYSARPGFSEHQTGLAVDIGLSGGTCSLQSCFGDTPAGQWLAANGAKYGFIVRYPKGKEAITGYQYEPWHLRYLGMDIAKAVEASGKTLDEFYTTPAGGYQ